MRIPQIASRGYLLKLAVVFVGYFVAGKLGLQVPFTDLNVSPVWPAAGVAVAAVLIWGYRVWPGIAAGAFCVNFFSPIPHAAAFGMALGNTASPLLAGYLLNQIRGFDKCLHRLRDVLLLTLIGSMSTVVAATVGTTTLYVNGLRPWAAFSSSWLVWWAGDSIGVILFAPLILSASEAWLQRARPQRIGEGVVLISGALLVCGVVFGEHLVSKPVAHVVAFGLFPFVMWAAIRFGILGTSVLSSGLALITVWQTANGHGPFSESEPLSNAGLLQVFLAFISLTGMFLAVVVREREAAEDRLARERELIRERDQAELERRQAEAALLRNEKLAAAGTLAATIAHEIRNPLSAITNIVYLLKSASLPPEIRHLIGLLATEVARVSYVAKNTLTFYREAAPPVPIVLKEIVEEILKVYAARLDGVRVECKFMVAGEIEGYPVEMYQVLSNLILNAAEATGRGGHVVVEICDAPDDSFRVTVRDDGPGIPDAIRDKIFQPFFSTKSGSGVGVGLWITQNIVQKHRGRLEFTDANPRGAQFTVVLPRHFAQASSDLVKAEEAS